MKKKKKSGRMRFERNHFEVKTTTTACCISKRQRLEFKVDSKLMPFMLKLLSFQFRSVVTQYAVNTRRSSCSEAWNDIKAFKRK